MYQFKLLAVHLNPACSRVEIMTVRIKVTLSFETMVKKMKGEGKRADQKCIFQTVRGIRTGGGG